MTEVLAAAAGGYAGALASLWAGYELGLVTPDAAEAACRPVLPFLKFAACAAGVLC